MYFVMFVGFTWYVLFSATYLGILSFPKNIFKLPEQIGTDPIYLLAHGGLVYGLNGVFLAWGYLGGVKLLSYQNFFPKEFLTARANSLPRGGRDSNDSKIYLKRHPYLFLVNIFRKYFRLLIPLLFATLWILYVLPFMAPHSPVYLVALRTQFLIPCEGAWWMNLTFIQNWLYWDNTYRTSKCYPYVTEGSITKDIDQRLEILTQEESFCQGPCGLYLQLFATLFQCFLMTPPLMAIHYYLRRFTYCFIALIILFFSLVTYNMVMDNRIDAAMYFGEGYMRLLSFRLWFRLPSYLMGLLLGLYTSRLHALRSPLTFTWPVRTLLYTLGLGLTLSCICILQSNNDISKCQ